MRSLLLVTFLAVMPMTARAEEPKGDGSPIAIVKIERKEPVDYGKDIDPIMTKKCTVCHSGALTEGKLDLGTYEGLMKGGKRGPSVKPGKPDESLLVISCGRTGAPKMPPVKEVTQKPLTPEELALLKLWVEQGAKAPATAIVRPKPVVTLPHAGVKPVRAVAIAPDKTVAAGRGNQIYLFDAKGEHKKTLLDPSVKTPDGKPVQAAHLSLVESLAYSPDGKILASGSYQEVIFWDADSGAVKQKLTGFADRVVAMAFSPDGKYLATGGGAATEDGEIKIFEVADGKLVIDIKKDNHSDTVFGVCFSPDGKLLATCGADKFVKVFEVPAGKFVKAFEGHTHHVMDVGWKNDGKLLASGGADNSIKIWDYEKGEQIKSLPNAHAKQVTRLVFVPKTGLFLTSSADNTVKKWNVDAANAAPPGNFAGGTDCMYAVAVSPDGAVVASGGEEGVIRMYDGNKGQLIKALVPPGEEPAPKK